MFYDHIKCVCEAHNTSPSALAAACGMSRSNVTDWKRGSSPGLKTITKLAKQLNVPVAELIPQENKEGESA